MGHLCQTPGLRPFRAELIRSINSKSPFTPSADPRPCWPTSVVTRTRAAISNQRLASADANTVAFRWKDYRIKRRDRMKVMRLATHAFIRRFLMHVLPGGFHRIRQSGFLANGIRRNRIAKIRRLLNAEPEPDQTPDEATSAECDVQPAHQPCPKCGGTMLIIETFKRGQVLRSRAPPWEDDA